MNPYPVSIALLFLCFLIVFGEDPTHFIGQVSINCGSCGTSAALNGREWLGDVKPKFSSLVQIKGSSSTASSVIRESIPIDPVPHRTARISRSKFSYEFQVSPGQKIIRLHFYPTSYAGFKAYKDLFTVESGPFTLLSNFSASLTADALSVNSFVKEFCLNVQENGQLSLSFSPSSLDAYAFINGIEIISVPTSLSYFHGANVGVQVVGQKSSVYVDYDTVLEVIQRLNMKQSLVFSMRDFDGMFPTWATQKLDKEKNSTWKIPVDVGFRYLIRLHFSGLGLKIGESDDVIFKFLINEMIVHTNVDIVEERNDIPWYRDYMVMMRGNKKDGKRDILISLQSYDELIDGHGLLAGFEVFKLSNLDNSLASPNPFPLAQHSPSLLLVCGHRNAIATVAIAIIALVNIIGHKSREIWEASSTKEENKPSARAERICRRFSLAEIQLATENFSAALLIGRGGFGRVYKGHIDNGQNIVAVKRLKPSSNQGSHEFLIEIEILSELRHVNLVSLIGYCNEHGEMILVYDYMACGTLADHLYKIQRESNNCSSLTWKQRIDICVGASRGLDYLHTGHGFIHRDVKTSNILLDDNFVAKVSDFGLAKPEDKSTLKSYVSTKVKGTFGYLDPYYFNTHKVTRKSDTYAFGVVLLEVLCGRPAVDPTVAENERILSKWAQDKIRKGEVSQIVASSLRDEISPDSLKTFVRVAERCLCDEPKNRPTMSQIVLQLEFALEQQESTKFAIPNQTMSVADNLSPSNGETISSVSTEKPTVASTYVPALTSPKMDNSDPPAGKKERRTRKTYKLLQFRTWDAFWNRVKPSKKRETSLISVVCAADKLRKFDMPMVAAATNHFSSSQKVGEGGFGSVYKAVLSTGQMVAVKRFSFSSRGFDCFKSEIVMLPNLHHQNIVKLLGYCIHGEQGMLLYEFMENRSLDTFIFEKRVHQLQWSVRFKIILGVAKGLTYLYQDSGFKIIHRDLKPSNILLDNEMNPKISGFGFAKSFDYDQSEVETSVAGTSGYISPEYAIEGKLSTKLDVFSFGVVVLEILSGSRNTNQRYDLDLIQHAWELWEEKTPMNLVEESIRGVFSEDEALRCIQVGLLCTQYEPHHRPTMLSVLKMLLGEESSVQEKLAEAASHKLLEAASHMANFSSTESSFRVSRFQSDEHNSIVDPFVKSATTF